jgi:TonB family protein
MRSQLRFSHMLALGLGITLAVALAGALGCGRPSEPAADRASRPDPRADRAERRSIEPPAAAARPSSGLRMTPIAKPLAGAISAADSAPPAGEVPESSAPAARAAGSAAPFQPPVLRQKCRLETPPGRHGGVVDLELRVNELGSIDEFRFAGGDADTVLIRAALDCVRVMRFYPAMRGGTPVAAWCRQRFTFDR